MATTLIQSFHRHVSSGIHGINCHLLGRKASIKRLESTVAQKYYSDESRRDDDYGAATSIVSRILFSMFKRYDTEMSIQALDAALNDNGINWKTDPRLEDFRTQLASLKEEKRNLDLNPDFCSEEELHRLIADHSSISVIAKALSRQCVIPDFTKFQEKIQSIFDTVQKNESGKLADYIPQLEREDPKRFGLALCTIDGQRMEIGDAQVPFCLQSCMKPFQYAVAISNHTSRYVHNHIGKEPSGSFFNAITLNSEDRPHNPMINAGALVVCSLLKPDLPVADRYVHVQGYISDMAAKEYTSFHNAVFQSERATAYRNFALAYLLKEKNCFPHGTSVEETVDLYLQLCAFKMTCSSASVAASTLANGGVCPFFPNKRILSPVAVRNTLSLMHSCGMYDYSGVFAFHVGLPAKSGVSGGLMLVVPNIMGVMIWSPLLDERGNSVRGLAFCKELVRNFNFHLYDNLRFSERKSDPRLSISPLSEIEEQLRSASSRFWSTDILD